MARRSERRQRTQALKEQQDGKDDTDRGTTTTTVYEARLGYLTLLFKVIQDGKDVKGGGNRFEIILPNARFMPPVLD